MKPSSYSQSIDIDLAIKEHLPLVKRIAHQICSRLPPNVEVDDLIQEGLTGLLDALTRYEPQANLNFEVYARTRIRGAIYDACRKNDILPRNQRDELEGLEKVTRKLEQNLGRHPSEREIADSAAMSIEAYDQGSAGYGCESLAFLLTSVLEPLFHMRLFVTPFIYRYLSP